MNNRNIFLLAFVLISGGLVSKNANAFYCNRTGDIQVAPPVLRKDTNSTVALFDLSSIITCSGDQNDNLAIETSSIDSGLANYGFTGVLNLSGQRFDMPASNVYIWPYSNSPARVGNWSTLPVNVIFELRRSSMGAWASGVTLPAGTRLATLRSIQHGNGGWGDSYPTWNLVLSAPLVIPAYTCNVTNTASHRVSLPDVDRSELRGIGKGIFTRSRTRFSIDLACEAMATVDMSIDGTKMTGKEDVLANLESGNDNIGIKVFPADNTTTPVVFDGSTNEVFESAAANESFAYDAYYYYDGGRFFPGNVRAQMTYTFTYR